MMANCRPTIRSASTFPSSPTSSPPPAPSNLQDAPPPFTTGHDPPARASPPAPSAGIFSPAPVFGRFWQMILNSGAPDGRQYLKPETIKLMTTLQAANMEISFTPGAG